MNDLKKDTANDSAVSLSQDECVVQGDYYFGDAPRFAFYQAVNNGGSAAIVSYDEGYFALGKSIKELSRGSGRKDVFFCLDDGSDAGAAYDLLRSADGVTTVIAIGAAELAAVCLKYAKAQSAAFLWLPTDFDYAKVISLAEGYKTFNIAFDVNYYEKLKKSTILSGFKSVLASRIMFVEMRVNELLNGFAYRKEIAGHINESLKACGRYISGGNVKELITANLIRAAVENSLPFTNPATAISTVLDSYKTDCIKSENEYFAYGLLLRLYSLFFLDDGDYLIRLPSVVLTEERIKQLKTDGETLYFPSYLSDLKKIDSLCSILRKDEILKSYIRTLTGIIEKDEKEIYYVYAGRKNTVEAYNAKQRGEALRLAPVLQRGESLFKIMWAAGYTEYSR